MFGTLTINMICLTLMRAAGAEDLAPPGPRGQITFLSVARTARKRQAPTSAVHAETLLRTASYLAAELAEDELPRELRAQVIIKLGELTAIAWADAPPSGSAELPAGVKRLEREARHADPLIRVAAESALRLILDGLNEQACAAAFTSNQSLAKVERAINTTVKIDHHLAVTTLLAISRLAAQPHARQLAATKLGELALRKAPDQFAESCVHLLLE